MNDLIPLPESIGTPCAKPEHEAFARDFALHGNATAAYRRVFGCGSTQAAKAAASRLRRDPDVTRRVSELIVAHREALLRATDDLDALTAQLAAGGLAGATVDEDGNRLPISEWPRHVRAAVESLEFDEHGAIKKVTFPKQLHAIRTLAELRGQLKGSTTNVAVQINGPSRDLDAIVAEMAAEAQRKLISRPTADEQPVDAEFTDVPPDLEELV